MIAVIVLVSMALCFLGYRIYGPWLARYVLQELTGWKGVGGAIATTILSTVMPLAFLLATKEKGYLVAWPIFGTANQLLASLTLLAVAVWLAQTGRKALFAMLPMLFMMAMALWSLVLLIVPFIAAIPSIIAGEGASPDLIVSGGVGIILCARALWLIVESARAFLRPRPSPASP